MSMSDETAEVTIPVDFTAEQYTHYIYSIVSPAAPVEDPNVLSHHIAAAMGAAGVPVSMGLAYVSPLFVDPAALGLANNWRRLPIEQKGEIYLRWPALAAAITLVVGTDDDKENIDG